MRTLSGRKVTWVFCTSAVLTMGCSAFLAGGCSSSSPGTSEDSGTPEDSGVTPGDTLTGDTSTSPTPDSAPPADAPADSAEVPDTGGSVEDSGTADTGGSVEDSGTTDSAADAGADAGGEGGGNPGALPAPVAIWEFQDPPGSTTAIDSSGNGHTATLEGTAAIVAGNVSVLDAGGADAEADAADAGGEDAEADTGTADAATDAAGADAGGSTLGMYGNYLQIDGTLGAFADVTGGPLFDNSQSFTVLTWVYFPSLSGNYDELISADGANVSVFELQLAPVAGTYNMEAAFPTTDVAQPGVFYWAFSTAPPTTATWYHLVGVYDFGASPGLISLYVDGVLQSNTNNSASTGADPVDAVGDFIIGAGKYNDLRTNGAVANYVGVRVYAQALTQAQVTTLYGLNGR